MSTTLDKITQWNLYSSPEREFSDQDIRSARDNGDENILFPTHDLALAITHPYLKVSDITTFTRGELHELDQNSTSHQKIAQVAITMIHRRPRTSTIVKRIVEFYNRLPENATYPFAKLHVYAELKKNHYILAWEDFQMSFEELEFLEMYHPPSQRVLEPKMILPLLRDVAKAIEYLHKNELVHRDIKLGNMVFTYTPTIKKAALIDLESMHPIGSTQARETCGGTPLFMAPERLSLFTNRNRIHRSFAPHYDLTKSDMWSFGICMYRLLCPEDTFAAFEKIEKLEQLGLLNQLGTFFPIIEHTFYCYPVTESPYNILVRGLIERTPGNRKSAEQVIESMDRLIESPETTST